MAKTILTKEEIQSLQDESRHLIDVDIPAVRQEMAEARAQGDLSENAEYHAARDRLASLYNRYGEIDHILSNYELSDTSKAGFNIVVGTKVVIFNELLKREDTITITGSSFADPMNGKISFECPLGTALKGKHIGDVCEVLGKKPYKITIVDIINK